MQHLCNNLSNLCKLYKYNILYLYIIQTFFPILPIFRKLYNAENSDNITLSYNYKIIKTL